MGAKTQVLLRFCPYVEGGEVNMEDSTKCNAQCATDDDCFEKCCGLPSPPTEEGERGDYSHTDPNAPDEDEVEQPDASTSTGSQEKERCEYR